MIEFVLFAHPWKDKLGILENRSLAGFKVRLPIHTAVVS
jgi:hypothetical protein